MKKAALIILALGLLISFGACSLFFSDFKDSNNGTKGNVVIYLSSGNGRAFDKPDAPAFSSIVFSLSKSGGSSRELTVYNSNSDGSYTIELEPGDYSVSLTAKTAPGYLIGKVKSTGPKEFRIDEDGRVSPSKINITIEPVQEDGRYILPYFDYYNWGWSFYAMEGMAKEIPGESYIRLDMDSNENLPYNPASDQYGRLYIRHNYYDSWYEYSESAIMRYDSTKSDCDYFDLNELEDEGISVFDGQGTMYYLHDTFEDDTLFVCYDDSSNEPFQYNLIGSIDWENETLNPVISLDGYITESYIERLIVDRDANYTYFYLIYADLDYYNIDDLEYSYIPAVMQVKMSNTDKIIISVKSVNAAELLDAAGINFPRDDYEDFRITDIILVNHRLYAILAYDIGIFVDDPEGGYYVYPYTGVVVELPVSAFDSSAVNLGSIKCSYHYDPDITGRDEAYLKSKILRVDPYDYETEEYYIRDEEILNGSTHDNYHEARFLGLVYESGKYFLYIQDPGNFYDYEDYEGMDFFYFDHFFGRVMKLEVNWANGIQADQKFFGDLGFYQSYLPYPVY